MNPSGRNFNSHLTQRRKARKEIQVSNLGGLGVFA